MKHITTLMLLAIVAGACSSSQKFSLSIPANDRVELEYPQYERYAATIKDLSGEGMTVSVETDEREQVSGFGLGSNSRATITVDGRNKLVLKNSSNEKVKFRIKVTEAEPEPVRQYAQADHVTFTLQNKSAKSIPLLIPTVMNPNLSPFSKSGVKLEIGQEILFKEKGKKYVLLTVDESIQNGDIVVVNTLLNERKKELGL